MKILLTGTSGFIGQHVLRVLYKQGHQVIAGCRHIDSLRVQFPDIKIIHLDFSKALNTSDWLPYLQSVDVVINAVGIIQESKANTFADLHTHAPIALFKACEQVGVKRVIQISALGAASDRPAHYHASKGRADDALKVSSLDWFILKPSIVYGSGAKSMGLFRALAALPVVPLIGDGQQLIQPVHIDDLVQAIMIAIQPETPARQIIAVVGPTQLSFAGLLQKLRAWLGKAEGRYLPVPIQLVKACAPIGRWMDEPALNKAAISMLEQGNTAEVEPFKQYLGYLPKSLDQVLQKTRATQADRWHAHLYLLRPMLRVAIAFVWLWAGWVSLFVYPHSSSYEMLGQVGIPDVMMPIILYGASAFDFILGLAMLLGWRLRWVVYCQLLIMLAYSIVISLFLPEYWVHPFGPMIKNLPLVVASFILLILEEQKP